MKNWKILMLVIGLAAVMTSLSLARSSYYGRSYYSKSRAPVYNRSQARYYYPNSHQKRTHWGHAYYQTRRFYNQTVRTHTNPRYPYDKN